GTAVDGQLVDQHRNIQRYLGHRGKPAWWMSKGSASAPKIKAHLPTLTQPRKRVVQVQENQA
ncbi:MAG: hypothetical protein KDC43_18850, partial [Saprospiraceae bacterium]|nr:hypothetical protein [Saprospiraceae bacterium]